MEEKLEEVFGNGILGKVAQAILNKEIYARLCGSIDEDEEGNPVGSYKFHFLSPATKDILNVSSTVGVLVDITYSKTFHNVEELKRYVKSNCERAYCTIPTTQIQGSGFDVVATFIADFSNVLSEFGIISKDKVLDESRSNYLTIEA